VVRPNDRRRPPRHGAASPHGKAAHDGGRYAVRDTGTEPSTDRVSPW
jgi:hypothetical protein